MAEARHKPYSFYVPENDAQLARFVASQSNLSLSVRLLMKAFLAAYKDDMQDVASADLSDLIRGVRLEHLAGTEVKIGSRTHTVAAPAQAQAVLPDAAAAPQAQAPAPAAPVPDPAPAAQPAQGPRAVMTSGMTSGAPTAVQEESAASRPAHDAPDRPAAPAPAPAQASAPVHTAAEPDPVPEVTEDPPNPTRVVGGGRAAYNSGRLPDEPAGEDDIMAMMGGM